MKLTTTWFLSLLGSSSAFATPVLNKSGLSALSVTELKRLLIERGVDFRDCLEKQDLVRRLEQNAVSDKYSVPVTPTLGTSFTLEEERLISTFKRVSTSVAFITTTVTKALPRGYSLRATEIPVGTGSGFLWDSEGHVVTNYHVLAGESGKRLPSSCKVKLAGMAKAVDAEVVGAHPDKDLAVLKIDPRNLPTPLAVGTSNDLQVGQSVMAIGNPFGLDNTLTKGIVSATGRDVKGVTGRTIRDCVQTDAAINPGNSGGPLLDSSGRLIGVNTAIYSPAGGNVGIGFAIPVDTVRRVVNQIIRRDRPGGRPSLGIHVLNDRIVRSLSAQLGRPLEGVLVMEILDRSPLKGKGFQPTVILGDGSVRLGDVLTHVNDQPVKQVEDLLAAIEELNGGDQVKLRVQREGNPNDIDSIYVRLASGSSFQ